MDEKQVQLEEDEKVWLYTAIDTDSEVVLHADFRTIKELIRLPSFCGKRDDCNNNNSRDCNPMGSQFGNQAMAKSALNWRLPHRI